MTAFTTEKIDVEPWFDMELFMGVSQETRLGGDVMDRFMTLWRNWLPHLTVKGIDTGKIKYLLVALDESVEQDVDKAWEGSPSNAFLYNALAQTMCMAAVHAVIPEVQDSRLRAPPQNPPPRCAKRWRPRVSRTATTRIPSCPAAMPW